MENVNEAEIVKNKEIEFTKQDFQNLYSLIDLSPITGKEAETVAILKRKILLNIENM